MKTTPAYFPCAIAALAFSLTVPAGAVSVPVTTDATVRVSLPNQAFGTAGQIAVDADSSSYLYFDLTGALPMGIPSSALEKATLYLYAGSVTTPGTVSVDNACTSWSEATITYSTRSSNCGGSVSFTVSQTGYVAADVTKLVGAWLENNLANRGIILGRNFQPSASVVFDSKENTATGHAPRLEITLVRATGPDGPAGAVGPVGQAGLPGPAVPGSTAFCSNGDVISRVDASGAVTCKCPPASFLVSTFAFFDGFFRHQTWRGGLVDFSVGSCSGSVNAPSGPVDHTTADLPSGWSTNDRGNWSSCSIMPLKPECGAPGAAASLVNGDFPSCSAALGGTASTAKAYVFCH